MRPVHRYAVRQGQGVVAPSLSVVPRAIAAAVGNAVRLARVLNAAIMEDVVLAGRYVAESIVVMLEERVVPTTLSKDVVA